MWRLRPPQRADGLLYAGYTSVGGAQAVECGLEDWFEVAGVAVDRGDGNDHVEDLLEGEVVADLVSALRGGEERPAGGDHSGAGCRRIGGCCGLCA